MATAEDLIRHIERQRGVRSIGSLARQGSESRELYATITNAIRKGTLPHLRAIEALRQAAGLSIGSVYLALGVNLDKLAWLRSQLNVNRTRPAPNRVFLPGTPALFPARFADLPKPYPTMPLSRIVSGWCRQPVSNLANWQRQPCLYAQVGLQDGISYPAIPPGAFLQIDPRFTTVQGVSDPHYYFLRHPYGYSCCRCAVDDGDIFLLPSTGLYPKLKFSHPGVVHIFGRVRGFCGRIDRVVPPPAIHERQLKSRREPMSSTPAQWAQSRPQGQPMLLDQRRCLGIPYEELDRATDLMHSLSDEFGRFHISNGHAHKIEHLPDFVPTAQTLYPLTAYYALDYGEALSSYGFSVDNRGTMDLSAKEARLTMSDVAATVGSAPWRSDFASFILDQWLEWPALLSQLGPDPRSKVFFFAGNRGMEPLLKPASFVVVDDSQTNIAASALSGWERPIYLFYLRQQGFVAGYAEKHGNQIHIVAHPQAADQRWTSFVSPDQGEVVGRITAVATRL
jgi:hypothetical protein